MNRVLSAWEAAAVLAFVAGFLALCAVLGKTGLVW